MKIVVATIGSRGDVQPYINLCQGLQAAGVDVTLATNPTLCSLGESHGVKTVPVGPAVDMGAVGARLMAQSFGNMWLGVIRVMQMGAKMVEEAYPDVLKAIQGADLVVTSDSTCGIAEAGRAGIPWISVTLQPARITVPKENPTFLDRTIFPAFGSLLAAPTNRFRKRVGAPLVSDISSMMSERMILLPVSRHVFAPDPHWPAQVIQTGYWTAREPDGWAPPEDLVDFLGSGERPIAVSLGVMSLSGRQAQEGARIILEAIRQAGVRAVVQGWNDLLKDVDVPDSVFRAGSLPHSWLFQNVSAVIHHGGFGTTAAVLRAGVPGIVVPHVIDQYYWGQRVQELGAGPAFIPRNKMRVGNISAAITRALSDSSMQDRAACLGEQIRSEPDGVTAAVQAVERLIRTIQV